MSIRLNLEIRLSKLGITTKERGQHGIKVVNDNIDTNKSQINIKMNYQRGYQYKMKLKMARLTLGGAKNHKINDQGLCGLQLVFFFPKKYNFVSYTK